jgi:hypothetical protein
VLASPSRGDAQGDRARNAVVGWRRNEIKFVFRNFRYHASAPSGERTPVSAAPVEVSMLMNIVPILSRRRSTGIRHNIAQFCQASCRSADLHVRSLSLLGARHSSGAYAFLPSEAGEVARRAGGFMSNGTVVHDPSARFAGTSPRLRAGRSATEWRAPSNERRRTASNK